jgi:hypothetical protein
VAYQADATGLAPGSILLVEKPSSSSNRPTYPHYFIVLAIPEKLEPGARIPLVGISSRIATMDPALHVEMKWLDRRGGDPETGFSKRCHACVDFTHVLEVYKGTTFDLEIAAKDEGRYIRADRLQTVVALTNAWSRRRE